MINGSCLCGTIRYRLLEPPVELCNCHCGMCRKAHGAAFATFAEVRAGAFELVAGDDRLVRYRSSEKVRRCFCPSCGAQIVFLYDEMPGSVFVTAGTLDDDPGVRPTSHIFAASKAPWHEITDDLPRHADFPRSG